MDAPATLYEMRTGKPSETTLYYVHKYEVWQSFGGNEEGGWHYESGLPVASAVYTSTDENDASEKCRALNENERERRRNEEDYDYYSVLSYRSTHYAYRVEEEKEAHPYPTERPHYE